MKIPRRWKFAIAFWVPYSALVLLYRRYPWVDTIWMGLSLVAVLALELPPIKKDQIDILKAVLWIPDSMTPNGVAEIPLTKIALEAFRDQVAISGNGEFLFPAA